MTLQTLQFDGFNSITSYRKYFIELNEVTFIFTLRWNKYSQCVDLSISDYYDNPIISGRSLVNNLKIRNHKLPYTLYFLQINGETYEPTLNNIANEFVLTYDDEEIK